ncbi:NAD-dependent epimerase/dehydratase family protein [Nisaea nitritireducens]|uniref:NAD-dependent epimerase/dehydratase family protein n=1 Tax=Nisaea nitritireducens TaxID=568392 RepID=UPI001867ACB5|nr:NAD-dependent epimerase/dehydratase family protein [Nisaea nitritireducens]
MHVLLLGGTGSIGSAILEELLSHQHQVTALARSDKAAEQLRAKGAEPLPGDLTRPAEWASAVTGVDAVIQAAAAFDTDMGAIDKSVLEAIAAAASGRDVPLRVLYTGGCWLFGETGNRVADESMPFDPLPSFAWMAENWEWLRKAPGIAPILIHPAMVYDEAGGVLHRYLDAASQGVSIEIWGSADVRWPLVHRMDLASAYRLALEKGIPGESYCVAAEDGVPTGALADAIRKRVGSLAPHTILPVAEAVARHGAWAAGPALPQRMSSRKIKRELGWGPRQNDAVALLGSRSPLDQGSFGRQ